MQTNANRTPTLWLLALLVPLAIQVSPVWHPGRDASAYLSVARSIAAGGAVTNLGSRQLYLPPGYPLLISPAFLVSARPFFIVSLLHFVLAALFLVGLYRWARRQFPRAAFFLTAFVMVNVSFWYYYRQTLSELAFMTTAIWTVEAMHWTTTAGTLRNAFLRCVAAGALLVLLVMIRPVGIFFACGFALRLLWQVVQSERRVIQAMILSAAVAAPAATAVLGLVLYERQMASHDLVSQPTYMENLVDPSHSPATVVVRGLRQRTSQIGQVLLPGMYKAYGEGWLDPNLLLYVPLVIWVAMGWWKYTREHQDVFALTLPFYLGLYVVWPYNQGTRFMLPVLPVFAAALWYAMERWPLPRRRIWAVLLLGHLGVSMGQWIAEVPEMRRGHAHWPTVDRLALDLRNQATQVAAVDVPRSFQLMLQFAIDLPVDDRASDASCSEEGRWVVVPEGRRTFEGFELRTTIDGYQLLASKPAAIVNTALAEQESRR